MVTRTIELLDERFLSLEKQDARRIRLTPLSPEEEIKDDDGTLIGIDYGDGDFSITVGSVITVEKKSKYKIDKILKMEGVSVPGYYLIMHTLTKSFQLIMPFLGGTRKSYRWRNNFCNCFIGKESDGDYASSIYLLYQWVSDMEYIKFEKGLMQHKWYVGTENPDKHHIMYEFALPKEHEDIAKILKGDYSLISPKGKAQILKFNAAGADSKLAKVFNKDSELREKLIIELSETERIQLPHNAELMSTFTPEKEMYLEKYRITDKKDSDDAVDEVW